MLPGDFAFWRMGREIASDFFSLVIAVTAAITNKQYMYTMYASVL